MSRKNDKSNPWRYKRKRNENLTRSFDFISKINTKELSLPIHVHIMYVYERARKKRENCRQISKRTNYWYSGCGKTQNLISFSFQPVPETPFEQIIPYRIRISFFTKVTENREMSDTSTFSPNYKQVLQLWASN